MTPGPEMLNSNCDPAVSPTCGSCLPAPAVRPGRAQVWQTVDRRLRSGIHLAVVAAAVAFPALGTPGSETAHFAAAQAGHGAARAPSDDDRPALASGLRQQRPVVLTTRQSERDAGTRRVLLVAAGSPVIRPVPGRVTSPFGWRVHPVTGKRRHHNGLDLAAPLGTTVRAAASGVVRSVRRRRGYGLTVELDHTGAPGLPPVRTLYAHLTAVLVPAVPGTPVGRGQPVALSGGVPGRDGLSTGPHLHFEVRDTSDRPQDPRGFERAGAVVPWATHTRSGGARRPRQVMFSSGQVASGTRRRSRSQSRPRSGFEQAMASPLAPPRGAAAGPRGLRPGAAR